MKITSRYSDIPEVIIDPESIPMEFRHLLQFAKEWSIGDDIELVAYIDTTPEVILREVADAFRPHYEALWAWHQSCEHLIPQPDELVMFDIATEAVDTVDSILSRKQAEQAAS